MAVSTIHGAARHGNMKMVKKLVKQGVSVDARDDNFCTPLHCAALHGHIDVARYLLSKHCDLEPRAPDGCTPLFSAARGRNKAIADLLIKSGSDLDHSDRDGWTILHHASHLGWLDIARLCIDRKCDLNRRNSDGKTPLLLAAGWQQKEIVDLLMLHGADVRCCSNDGWTLLHCVCRNGWSDVVEACIYSLDHEDMSGNTPLHVACSFGNVDTAKCLLQSGAKCNVVNHFNETAFTYAVQRIPEETLIELFIANGSYFMKFEYLKVFKNLYFRQSILSNPELCSQIIVNKFNNYCLCKFYDIYEPSVNLPVIENMLIKNNQNVAHEVKNCVEWEIQSKGHCDVICFNPMVLKMLCVTSLISNNSISSEK